MSVTPVTPVELRTTQTAAYGGMADALGGIATAALAIIGLAGFDPEGMAAIATIVLGATLLVQGGTIVSEYANLIVSAGGSTEADRVGGEGLPALFLVGAGGIGLGVLALLGIASATLIAVAAIAFGSALLLGSNLVRRLYLFQMQTLQTAAVRPGKELLAGQMAGGTAGFQLLAGLATIVLGILAVAGNYATVLTLAALLLLGVTVLLTGSTLSGLVLSFMRPTQVESRRFGSGSALDR